MLNRMPLAWIAAVLVSLLICPTCEIDETYTGLGEGALPGDPLRPIPIPCNADCGSGTASCPDMGNTGADVDYGTLDVDDLTGTAYRFDSLVITAPLTGVMGDSLNGYFADEISAGNLNVLLVVTGDDRDSGALTMQVGPADADGNEYDFAGENSILECNLQGRYFSTVVPAELIFPNDLLNPPELPIKQLQLSGWLLSDGSAIETGFLDGVLTEEDALSHRIMGMDFVTFLEGIDAFMDLDTDDDGTPDAWRFLMDFTTTEVTFAGGAS